MKVKTSELTYNQLSYAVCLIEMPHLVWGESIGLHWASNQVVVPIIEREAINIRCMRSAPDPTKIAWWESFVFASSDRVYQGSTPLIAAMRCYVASKLGDEVEIPEELA